MIVDSGLYRAGARVAAPVQRHGLAGLRTQATEDGDFVWVGLHEPSAGELADVAEAFGLHPLAVEDAVHAHQRPKLEQYDGHLFLILKTLWYVDAQDAVETGEVALFVGRDFVVSVRHGEGGELGPARTWLEGREHLLAHGPTAVVYAVCDQVVDAYERVASALQDDVDEVEASVFSDDRTNDSARIYVLKRELAECRRAALPLRDPMSRFAAGAVAGLDAETGHYFRDVADHLSRVAEAIDGLETLLSAAFEAHLAQISIRQNDDMRRVSATVGLIAAPALVGSVYGMNFEHMPELDWTFGYPLALLLMAASSFSVWILSRRAGWL